MQNYSFLQKFLHRIILGNENIGKMLFDIEKYFFYNLENEIRKKKHIFISGLPRSGTTILLQSLYRTRDFASIIYQDMPFVVSPNLFNLISSNKKGNLKERIHGDRINTNIFSPEAFDEIFFSLFAENEEEFISFVGLYLLKNNKSRYLSKNNNNYRRVNFIKAVFPNSVFLVPYRDPLQQSLSLLNQHQKFIKFQKKDKFVLDYMNFLGHCEFGLNYIRWNSSNICDDTNDINHWLEQWYLFYEKIFNNYKDDERVIFIPYEDLCKVDKLSNKLALVAEVGEINPTIFENKLKEIDHYVNPALIENCKVLVHKLSSTKNNLLNLD
tara:strand:+ start:12288 stop:13265 length:978 start_codon:yes stop_codon:yes gene_type:complete